MNVMNVDQELTQEKYTDKFSVLLNQEDHEGNRMTYNPDTCEITMYLNGKSKGTPMGRIEHYPDGTYVWKKFEREEDVLYVWRAWTINEAILRHVDVVIFTTDLAEYRISKQEAYLRKKPFKSPNNLDKKVTVPLEFWNIRFLNAKSQAIAKLIGEDWCRELRGEFDDPYMTKLQAFIWQRRRSDAAIVYPEPEDVFKAFKVTPFGQVKVVILGQDPYHSPGTANGLAFSTDDDTVPPSLDNIFKELESDVGDGLLLNLDPDLTRWAEQGVFLLNRILTVEEGKPLAHADKGWEIFTRHVIEILNAKRKNVVYMLWGTYAQKLQPLIDPMNNLVLTAAHPSPLSAHKGFLGCKHFSQANEYLVMHKKTPIQWV